MTYFGEYSLQIIGQELERMYSFKYLGMILDEVLLFSEHVEHLYNIRSPTFEMPVNLNIPPLAEHRHLGFVNEYCKSVHVNGYSLSEFFVPIVCNCNRITRAMENNAMVVP